MDSTLSSSPALISHHPNALDSAFLFKRKSTRYHEVDPVRVQQRGSFVPGAGRTLKNTSDCRHAHLSSQLVSLLFSASVIYRKGLSTGCSLLSSSGIRHVKHSLHARNSNLTGDMRALSDTCNRADPEG